jgi:transcription termination factor NusB
MASNRHLGRIVALQTLYEFEIRNESKDESVDVESIWIESKCFQIRRSDRRQSFCQRISRRR